MFNPSPFPCLCYGQPLYFTRVAFGVSFLGEIRSRRVCDRRGAAIGWQPLLSHHVQRDGGGNRYGVNYGLVGSSCQHHSARSVNGGKKKVI